MTNFEEKFLDWAEIFILDDVLALFIMSKKEEKWKEFKVLIEWKNVLEFWWFEEPTEDWNNMHIGYTDYSTHWANWCLKDPTLWDIRWMLLKLLK